jgi:CHAD domain-containing protein
MAVVTHHHHVRPGADHHGDDEPEVTADGSPIRPGTAGAVVAAHLGEQLERLLALDGPVRADVPDAVHQMRVATRRLRSALATFRPVLDRGATDLFRDELRWLAASLGRARDAEVLRDRLITEARALPPDLLLGPVVDRIDTEMRRRHAIAHDQLVRALDDRRYRALRANAERFLHAPPMADRADKGERWLAGPVEKACRRVERVATRADADATDPDGLRALHELRKAAKRARYAAEAVEPVFGGRAERLAERMEDLQEVLGEHQDSVGARAMLRELGVVAHLSGENGFSFGLLHEHEATASRTARAELDRLVRRATDRPKKASLR